MVNQTLPQELSSLRDIHLPESIGWWPLAPGWYLLATSIVIACLLIGFLGLRYYSNGRAKREALRRLAMYKKQYELDANSQLCTANISELLKRLALSYYPRTQIAALQGEAWIAFLNRTGKGVEFNSVRTQLLEMPWRPSRGQPLEALFKTAKKWIVKQGKPCSS